MTLCPLRGETGKKIPVLQPAPWAITKSQQLIGAVRNDDERALGRLLMLPVPILKEVTTTLAAMVPDDQSPSELLSWRDPDAPVRRGELKPCGTHAGFNRHKGRGELPCDDCRDGERLYQRLRGRRIRRERVS